jgi:hypothetical protein
MCKIVLMSNGKGRRETKRKSNEKGRRETKRKSNVRSNWKR